MISKLIYGHKNRIINNKLYYKIIHYKDLNKNEIIIKDVAHDGNCYYNCMSKFLFDDEIYHDLLTNNLYTYIKNKDNIIYNHIPFIEYL